MGNFSMRTSDWGIETGPSVAGGAGVAGGATLINFTSISAGFASGQLQFFYIGFGAGVGLGISNVLESYAARAGQQAYLRAIDLVQQLSSNALSSLGPFPSIGRLAIHHSFSASELSMTIGLMSSLQVSLGGGGQGSVIEAYSIGGLQPLFTMGSISLGVGLTAQMSGLAGVFIQVTPPFRPSVSLVGSYPLGVR